MVEENKSEELNETLSSLQARLSYTNLEELDKIDRITLLKMVKSACSKSILEQTQINSELNKIKMTLYNSRNEVETLKNNLFRSQNFIKEIENKIEILKDELRKETELKNKIYEKFLKTKEELLQIKDLNMSKKDLEKNK